MSLGMLRKRSDNLYQENKVWQELEAYFQQWRQADSFEKWVQQVSFRPNLSLTKILLYPLAAVVNFLSLGFWVLAVWIVFTTPSFNFWTYLAVAVLLMFGWISRPRFVQPDGEPMTRAQFPHLFRLIDRVAAEMGMKAPTLVTYDHTTNVIFSRTGLQNRPWLKIGMGLWAKLSPQERVALIAHGLAHDRNGDSGRNLWITNALLSLHTWYEVIFPDVPLALKFDVAHWAIWSLIKIWLVLYHVMMSTFFFLLTRPIYGLIWVFQFLLTDDTRRAEYYADEITAQIAGTESAISLQHGFRHTASDSHLYFSHPTPEYRIRFLQARPTHLPKVRASEAEMRQIDEELAKPYQRARRELDKLGVIEY